MSGVAGRQGEKTPKDNREGVRKSKSTYLAILPGHRNVRKFWERETKESSFVLLSIWFSLSNYTCKALFHLVSYSQVQVLICSKKILSRPGRQGGHRKMPMDTQWKEMVLQFLYQGSDNGIKGNWASTLTWHQWGGMQYFKHRLGLTGALLPPFPEPSRPSGEPICISKMERWESIQYSDSFQK